MKKNDEMLIKLLTVSNINNPLPVPPVKERAKCICCNRSLRIYIHNTRWDSVKRRHVKTSDSTWRYVIYDGCCRQKCLMIYGMKSIYKKLKIN
jgi:hypothetical protein